MVLNSLHEDLLAPTPKDASQKRRDSSLVFDMFGGEYVVVVAFGLSSLAAGTNPVSSAKSAQQRMFFSNPFSLCPFPCPKRFLARVVVGFFNVTFQDNEKGGGDFLSLQWRACEAGSARQQNGKYEPFVSFF